MNPSSGIRRALSMRSVWVVVKKEFLDNVRSKWIVAISAIFIILALVVSYFGAAETQGRTGFQALSNTVSGMVGIESILVPILALMLSYGAVVGEKEGGSMLLLLSMPITRLETVLGKFLGLGAVLMTAIVSGLGIAGAVIVASAGIEGWENYLLFVLGSIVFALAFLSIGLLMSTAAKRRSTAIALAVLLWFFFAVIFDTILLGVYVAAGGAFDFTGGAIALPDWYFAIAILNPIDAFGFFSASAFGLTQSFGFPIELPSFVTVGTASLSMVLWTAIPLATALWLFRRQDL